MNSCESIANADFMALSIADAHVTSAWGNLPREIRKNEDSMFCNEQHNGGRDMKSSGVALRNSSFGLSSVLFIPFYLKFKESICGPTL